MKKDPVIVGVRHHSPACARLVRTVIQREKPAFVLIEGPCDMNDRLGELRLRHTPPIAIFSYRAPAPGLEAKPESEEEGAPAEANQTWSSWCPFCDYSPEWVAIKEAHDIGAKTLFNDLPAWHKAFEGIENRYSDRHQRASDRITEVCARLGFEDVDGLWDHLFEQPQEDEDLERRLSEYFDALRADEPAGPRDEPREDLMAKYIAWAMAQKKGTVVVVCGGFHKPALERLWKTVEAKVPPVPKVPDTVRIGSYLVPYSFHRLDAFTGYQSGMPSPLFYQKVWDEGQETAAESMLFEAIKHLREKLQRVSPADSIAASTLAHGLKMIRGHEALARIDVLDGLASALVKDSLEAPLPWNRRGTLLARTDPMLVEIVAAFSGDRIGKLAPETPRPPLVHDAFAELENVGIELTRTAKVISVSMTDEKGLRKSRVLHRLRVLGIPGFTLKRAMKLKRGETDLSEQWSVQRALDADAALVEAAMFGATLESATVGKLEHRTGAGKNIAELAEILGDAVLCGIHTLTGRLLADVTAIVGREPSLGLIGAALTRLLALWHHDAILGSAHAQDLGRVVALVYDRGLWLVEGIQGATAAYDKGLVDAIVSLRDTLRHGGGALALSQDNALGLCMRKMQDADAPSSIRGAMLGFAWSIAGSDPTLVPVDRAVRSVRGTPTDRLGDMLAGLFALAREEVRGTEAVLGAVDEAITGMERHEFLIAAPALRLAFNFFPPREKLDIAKAILGIHDADKTVDPRWLTKPEVAPAMQQAGMQIDADIDERAKRYGLS
jgi:hypothetical protein